MVPVPVTQLKFFHTEPGVWYLSAVFGRTSLVPCWSGSKVFTFVGRRISCENVVLI